VSKEGIDTFVLKLHSRCNLNCRYCNIYNGADTSYALQPARMTPETAEALARRIREYKRADRDSLVTLVFHGGEPLLVGRRHFENILERLAGILGSGYRWTCQTNGVLLDRHWVDLFAAWDVSVGISLDGPAQHHDHSRVDAKGQGSHAAAVQAIRLLQSTAVGRRLFSGTIGVINLACPPEELFEHLIELGIERAEILLPDSHWGSPPPVPQNAITTCYGEYLSQLFDCWLVSGAKVRVGFFEACWRLMSGQKTCHEFWGLAPLSVAVVDADGSLEIHDAFRMCADGLTKQAGLNVHTHPIVALETSPLMGALLSPQSHLGEQCAQCSWCNVCGGGMPAHRWSPSSGLLKPSVYCESIKKFLTHVRAAATIYHLSVG